MRVRIIVADRSEARFYDMTELHGPPRLVEELRDAQARLYDRDYKSDKPGRVFDHASGGGRRGAVAHHSTQGERSPSKHEADVFAQRIVAALEQSQGRAGFDRLVLVAEPGFLGRLRAVLPKALQDLVGLEIHKDLVHQDERALAAHLTPEIFAPGP